MCLHEAIVAQMKWQVSLRQNDSYDSIKQAIAEDGLEGLLEKSLKSARFGNRVAPELEQRILEYGLEFPTHGQPESQTGAKAPFSTSN